MEIARTLDGRAGDPCGFWPRCLGPKPDGFMIYDPAAGQMCTVFNDTTRPRWAGARPTEAEKAEKMKLMTALLPTYRTEMVKP